LAPQPANIRADPAGQAVRRGPVVLCDDAWMTGPVEFRPGSLADLPALYRRYGFRPTWSYLSRFAGR